VPAVLCRFEAAIYANDLHNAMPAGVDLVGRMLETLAGVQSPTPLSPQEQTSSHNSSGRFPWARRQSWGFPSLGLPGVGVQAGASYQTVIEVPGRFLGCRSQPDLIPPANASIPTGGRMYTSSSKSSFRKAVQTSNWRSSRPSCAATASSMRTV
jgi:hypothetical protein